MLTNCLIIQTLHFTFSLTDTVRFVADLSSEVWTQNSTYLPSSVISGSYITSLHLLLLYQCISTTWLIVGLASLSSSTLCRANSTKLSIVPMHICLPRHQSFVLVSPPSSIALTLLHGLFSVIISNKKIPYL